MNFSYSDEKNVQILIALLKAHGIKKVIVSPGTGHISFVGSIQNDSWFELYSSVDERSAAYMACGLAFESNEPVCISCTGATAARNYMPGLTEAYYRKLPVLAITGSQPIGRVGHHVPQVTDRSSPPKDVVKVSVTLPMIHSEEEEWECEIKVNQALLELKRHGGGPVHINVQSVDSTNFNTKHLPNVRMISRITPSDMFPAIPDGQIAIFVGSHSKMSVEFTETLDSFCERFNAVVFTDHTSGYNGKYKVLGDLVACQMKTIKKVPDLLMTIGDISGAYYSFIYASKRVWRISEDGELRDTFRRLQIVFEMPEIYFFRHYLNESISEPARKSNTYFDACKNEAEKLYRKIPDLPFSNIWIAQQTAHRIPKNSTIHLAILNSLRAWNFYAFPETVDSISNVGGFGIDGCMSTLIGASLANTDRLHYLVIGDLAFFYDLNSLGNRHLSANIRILLVNNGKGTEFKNFNHPAYSFGEDADLYIAAAGHFGNQSADLVKHYAQDLGFEYLSAGSKNEYLTVIDRFLSPQIGEAPMLLEVFINSQSESDALEIMMNLDIQSSAVAKATLKSAIKSVAGEKGIRMVKRMIENGKPANNS